MDRKKAVAIPPDVKKRVSERDSFDGWPCCILCGSAEGQPNAHVIPRSDNGMGIEPEQLIVLNALQHENPLRPDEGNGIGVRNVISRLQLVFNGDIRVKVTSEPGCDTEVFLDLPLVMEDVKDGLYISGSG